MGVSQGLTQHGASMQVMTDQRVAVLGGLLYPKWISNVKMTKKAVAINLQSISYRRSGHPPTALYHEVVYKRTLFPKRL